MRSFLAICSLSIMVAAPAAAQGMSFGVVGGFVSSNVTFSTGQLDGQKARSGFAIGVSLGIPASGAFQLAPEAMYVEKGIAGNGDGADGDIKLGYIEVPILLRYSFPTGAALHPFLTAGPTFADRVSCKLSATDGGTTASEDCGTDDNGNNTIASTDVGIMFGGGIAGSRLSLSVRYEIGLTNLINDSATDATAKNKALFVLAGIAF